jgi:hypothetical protein
MKNYYTLISAGSVVLLNTVRARDDPSDRDVEQLPNLASRLLRQLYSQDLIAGLQ